MSSDNEEPRNLARRKLLSRLGLGLAVAYVAPVLVQVGEARASRGSRGSGSGRRWRGRGSYSGGRGSYSRGSSGRGSRGYYSARYRDYPPRYRYEDGVRVIIDVTDLLR